MTWIVGGNCFNGFVCAADIQATIQYSSGGQCRFFNCVQKIHKIFRNLCVAFSGDIRSGLLIIEDLKGKLAAEISDEEYFDIDGQSQALISYLKYLYKYLNPRDEPYLEFMFMWMAQEGDEAFYRPFCMKFKAPEFHMNSTPLLGVAQSGSGIQSDGLGAIFSLLSGKVSDSAAYKKLWLDRDRAPTIWTVKKFKNLLFHEASSINYPGVSRSFISYEAEIAFKDMYPDWSHRLSVDLFKELGVQYSEERTPNNQLNLVSFGFERVGDVINSLKNRNPEKLSAIGMLLTEIDKLADITPILRLPDLISDQYVDGDEEIHSPHLIAYWNDMVDFLGKNGVNVRACSAVA